MSPFHPSCLEGRSILITGGCGALGVGIVSQLVAHGAIVFVNDVLAPDDVPAALRHERIHYCPGDARDETVVKNLFDSLSEGINSPEGAPEGAPDCVIAHAGAVEAHAITDWTVEQFDAVMSLNVRSSFVIAREAARRMSVAPRKPHPRKILFTSSWVENVPWPEIGPYTASKAAVRMLMRSFARELCDKHIVCNALSPGIVGAGMALKQWNDSPSYRARAEKAIPLGRLQDVESVARAMLFLCCDASNYMTGSTLLVDGGCSLYPMI
jgi:NAD(P)-dependent dehydrogenase (short-subunit alcohol dehydrogenase family)